MAVTPGVDERLVADLWERRAVRQDLMDSMELKVIYPGTPSDAGGPDYQDAVLSWADRSLITGDIEFHVRSSDWYRHRHDSNNAYNRVILHVVWENDAARTVRQDGRVVPVLELRRMGPGVSTDMRGNAPASLIPHSCVAACCALSEPVLRERLEHAGGLRLGERGDQMVAELEHSHADQVAYSTILEAMGYASNRQAFRALGEAVPYAWLQSVSPNLWKEALLIASGFKDSGTVEPPVRMNVQAWRLARLRPGNHPARRVEGVALLLSRFAPRLVDTISAKVLHASGRAEIRALFMSATSDQSLIGAGRADELVASAILPLVGLVGGDHRTAENLMRAYYSPPSTRWTRSMARLLEEAGHTFRPRNAAQHQGMHHVYTRHCRYDRRSGCPLCGNLQG